MGITSTALQEQAISAIRSERQSLIEEQSQINSHRVELEARERDILRRLSDLDAAERVFGGAPQTTDDRPQRPIDRKFQMLHGGSPVATVRDVALFYLQERHPQGVLAREIRDFYAMHVGGQLHDKTIGMTLYRLSQEKIARREGHIWFLVPPELAETKNPDAPASGPTS